MSPTQTATVNSRINIPISSEIRSQLEEIAADKGVSLAQLGRHALESYLAEERRRIRLQRLCETATKYADIIEGVAKDWRATELEGWSDE